MTGIDLSDINIDLTYQDGLRLSELYGRLGELQTKMDHLDLIIFHDQLMTALFILAIAAGVGLFVLLGLCALFDDSSHADRNIILGIALYVVIVATIVFFSLDYTATYTELQLESDMRSTQMQIDAILMKYGWEGI